MKRWRWSCGHEARSTCQECWRLLVQYADQMTAENRSLREEIELLRRTLRDRDREPPMIEVE